LKGIKLIVVLLLGLFTACKEVPTESRRIPVEDFFRNPEKSNMLISPDGSCLSYIQNYKNRPNIFCQNLTTKEVVQLTFDTIRGISNYVWVDADQLIYLYDIDGTENYQLYSIKNNGKNLINLTPYKDVRLRFLDIAPKNSEEIYICLNKRKKEVFDLYKLNVNTGKLRMIDENPGNISYWKQDQNGEIRLAVTTDGVNEKILFRETTSSSYKEVISLNFKETLYPISFTEDGTSVYALSNLNRDKVALVKFNLLTAQETEVVFQHKDVDVNDMSFSYKNNKPLFTTFRTNKLSTHYLDPSLAAIEKAIQKIDKESSYVIVNYTIDDQKFLIKLFSDKNIGTYYIFDIQQSELQEIAKVSPWLKEEELATTNPINFKSRDGLSINAYLTLPKEKQEKYPLIVLAHPNLWQRTRWGYNPEVQFFANRGFAVVTVNHRGVDGFGKNFYEAGFKEVGKKMQDDYTDAVYHLIGKGIIDTARIGIYGLSFGGYFALNGLIRDSGLYRCAASYSGFTNLFSYIKEIPPYYKQYLDMVYEMIGDPEKDVEYLRECSPAFHTDNINVPIFIAHGEKDQRMSVSEINEFVKTLKKKNVKVNYLLMNDEGHGFRKEENKINLYTELETFFEENLLKK
jgi:dipeptidyl aminopeptidase/acylaminoacyl peptidase